MNKQAFTAGYSDKRVQGSYNNFVSYDDLVSDDPDYKPVDTFLLWGGVLGSMFLQHLIGSRLEKHLDRTPNLPKEKIYDILEDAGLSRDFPTFSFPGLGNAAYVPPMAVGSFKRPVKDFKGNMQWEGLSKDKVKDIKKRGGMIIYDPAFLKAGIMGHEAGHAKMGNRKWWNPSKLNQNFGRWLGIAGIPIGTALGTRIGANVTDNPFVSALAGAAIGGGIGLATDIPTLINESQASSNAKKYLDKSKHKKDTVKKNKKVLKKALGTYALAATATPAILSGIYAGKYT